MAGIDAQAAFRIDAARCCDGPTVPRDGVPPACGTPGEIRDVLAGILGVEMGTFSDPVTGQAAGHVPGYVQ